MQASLNLTGGDCVEDLEKLEGESGMALYMGQIVRAVGGKRDIPLATSVREWLEQFHPAAADAPRGYGQAYVPEANEALGGLRGVNREFLKVVSY